MPRGPKCGWALLSETWLNSGKAQGRVLSLLFFNLVVTGLAVVVRSVSPGVPLMIGSDVRLVAQLHADDLILVGQLRIQLADGP